MTAIHVVLGVALVVSNLAAGLWGGWCWWRVRDAPGFWPLLRVGQGLVMLQAVDGAVLLLLGEELPELHLIYGLVPLGVSFLAEQLRLAAADTVLAQHDLAGRADVEALPEPEQRELVRAIVRREIGVMAASALVVAVLGVRAGGWL
ncbi:MAG TPA: hypothetical protein VNO82_13970 [Solirubrobacteraceae bacterium]|nr:hypothetical protein [Solirubrobacteraceae bacterium]